MIEVYRDWSPGERPERLGVLRVRPGRASEVADFTFDESALSDPTLAKATLDPDLGTFAGVQFPRTGRTLFGVFEDSSPDRWGETLICRRFNREKRSGRKAPDARLGAADYLLGVHDLYRSGAIRYKLDPAGPYLDDDDRSAAPPFVRLRELEAASRGLESSGDDDPAIDEWLRLLMAPGASLGGARPKASVVDLDGRLWIAKFPSVRDRIDVGGWEYVVANLAERAGLRVSKHQTRTFASAAHTFLVRRFDRLPEEGRIHFASAMTLTGHADGDDASSGASYLEIAETIMSHGASPNEDLLELWSRIAFNVMVSNTDDHLRNHGFLLSPKAGWRLSEAYDMNPVPHSSGLCLNIDENDNALDLDLVRSVARYFRVKDSHATAIVTRVARVVAGWREIADAIGIGRRECEEMAGAFSVRPKAVSWGP